MKNRSERAVEVRAIVADLLAQDIPWREIAGKLGVSKGALESLMGGGTPQEDTLRRMEEGIEREGLRPEEVSGGYDPAALNLPDTRFLHPAAQDEFDKTIGNWVRKWSTETVERAAVLLLGYFNRTSTLQSSGTYVPELSEEMQIHVLRESREEIENAYRDLGGGPKR